MGKATREALIEIIKELNVSAGVDIDKLDDDAPLSGQGLDSLDIMNFYFHLEETFGIKIDDQSIEEEKWNTINSILKQLDELSK